MRPLVAHIDLAALKSNFNIARQAAPDSQLFAVIKADGYGHGAIECAQALTGADGFSVASIEEAIQLRQAKVDRPILVLSSFSQSDEVGLLDQYRLMPVIHSRYQLELIQAFHHLDLPLRCWLKINTGMNRLGLSTDELEPMLETITAMENLQCAGVMSHLASADETGNPLTDQQAQCFKTATAGLDLPLSLANSAGILAWPQTRKHWNRPGLMLYGASPLAGKTASEQGLEPVMTLSSELIAVKPLASGQGIGYGHDFIADADMVIGIVAGGYADGYPRHAASGTPVLVSGQRTRTLGRVSMDTLAVDLTGMADVRPGTPVTLWGNGLPVEEIAMVAGTAAYELLTRVTARVPRNYSEPHGH